MTTRVAHRAEDLKILEYVLDDFLELKASLNTNQTQLLKEFLFSRRRDGLHIFPVEGFLWAKSLVVFESRSPDEVEHLIFLNPQDGKIQVKHL